jgi:DNA modification methylase
MKPGASIYVAHADVEGLNFRRAFKEAGFKLQSCLMWHKNNFVIGRWDFQPKHEPILYGWKPGAGHKWYGGRKQTTVIDFGEGSPFVQMPDGRWQIKVGDNVLIVDGAAQVEEAPGTTMYEPKPARSDLHPTQKPVALVERMLKNSARPGAIVADAFGGSGTTMIASERNGMRARLLELDPKYVDVIVTRWQQYTGERAVHALTGELFPRDEEGRATDAHEAAEETENSDPF